MTQAIPDLNKSRSAPSARAAPASDQVAGGDGGPRLDEGEGRLAPMEASGHLLPLRVRQCEDIDDGPQAMLRYQKPTVTDVPAFCETYSYDNHLDPWLEQPDPET